ncbi:MULTISPECIES: DNA-binding protein [unclassified Streptomyces]|uniref:DNA-binding protein n=1 Tax=unclassified Streptomyces TaxID=2593676 RepID=UPI0029B03EA6|nr:DNA-binding protein [Streptomyces sp. DK15]MDX2392018.1 DNA-binding protein [Streptomyces sp. DK15]
MSAPSHPESAPPATAPAEDPRTPLGPALDTIRRLVALDTERGATAAVPAVRETLRRFPELSADPASLHAEDGDLLAALAELAEVIGWILFDAGLHPPARRMNARALALAGLCGDRWTARLVLLNHSMLEAHTGRPRAALASAARVGGPKPLPARVHSLVLIRQAHAIAMLGDRREPLALIGRARSRFLDGVSRRDPHWAWWIDESELLGHRGWVLARLRYWDRAIPLLHAAATAPGPSYRHLFTAELLAALVRAGAWNEAEDLVAELAPRAAAIGSARTTGTLRRTARDVRRSERAPGRLKDAAVHLLESLPA